MPQKPPLWIPGGTIMPSAEVLEACHPGRPHSDLQDQWGSPGHACRQICGSPALLAQDQIHILLCPFLRGPCPRHGRLNACMRMHVPAHWKPCCSLPVVRPGCLNDVLTQGVCQLLQQDLGKPCANLADGLVLLPIFIIYGQKECSKDSCALAPGPRTPMSGWGRHLGVQSLTLLLLNWRPRFCN